MDLTHQRRTPAGSPTGGQFTQSSAGAEADTGALASTESPEPTWQVHHPAVTERAQRHWSWAQARRTNFGDVCSCELCEVMSGLSAHGHGQGSVRAALADDVIREISESSARQVDAYEASATEVGHPEGQPIVETFPQLAGLIESGIRQALEGPHGGIGGSRIDSDGHIEASFNTRSMDLESDVPVPELPACLEGDNGLSVRVEYADTGDVMTQFTTPSGQMGFVVAGDNGIEIHLADGSMLQDDGWRLGTSAMDRPHPDDVALAEWASAMHSRAMQAESAVRYAALEATRTSLTATITGKAPRP